MSLPPTPTPTHKHSLSVGSPRASPFRRAQSPLPASPSTVRANSPATSPLKPTPTATPAELSPTELQSPFRSSTNSLSDNTNRSPAPWLARRGTSSSTLELPPSPTRKTSSTSTTTATSYNVEAPAPAHEIESPSRPLPTNPPSRFQRSETEPPIRPSARRSDTSQTAIRTVAPSTTAPSVPIRHTAAATVNGHSSADPLATLPPHLLHTMRESFSVLDRSASGSVTRSDVSEMLEQLGLDSSPGTLSQYLPSNQSISLAAYLHQLAELYSGLSRPEELRTAFEAFDTDDSGQVDLGELMDALLNTMPEKGERALSSQEVEAVVGGFSGRRALGKGMRGLGGAGDRGEVFRWGEFVAALGAEVPGAGQEGGKEGVGV
ncbi:hypothetical protein H2201_004353 [Coniosporium apollinis]|uniref:EF-hand domain-containing protein n=1 Tax=Coniosporium apollinis TaxID=61459 RepID=A0ABQ9NV00_9PEZI|nr:hypothetical protein H2201_004353 [Coniosporium apollinis]